MIQAESSGNLEAVGPTVDVGHGPEQALGGLQVLPSTMRDPGVKGVKPIDPETSTPEEKLQFGKDYFNGLLNMFNGDLVKAVTAYHMGHGAVKRGEKPGPATKAYVKKVLGE